MPEPCGTLPAVLRAIVQWLLAFAPPSVSEPCEALAASEFATNTGSSLTATASCGSYILSTDSAMNVPFSWGQMTWPEPAPENFRVDLTWRRLTPDTRRSVELHVPGGAVMIREGQWSYFESNSTFAASGGYKPLVGHDASAEHTLRLEQRAGAVRLWVDGQELPPTNWGSRPEDGEVTVALKGEPGMRSRVWIRSVRVTVLPDPPISVDQSQ